MLAHLKIMSVLENEKELTVQIGFHNHQSRSPTVHTPRLIIVSVSISAEYDLSDV